MKSFFLCCSFLLYLFVSALWCYAGKIHLKYKIVNDIPENTEWVDIGIFNLKKKEIRVLDNSNNHINEKRNFLKQLKVNKNYVYILVRLCYNIEEGTDKSKIKDKDAVAEERFEKNYEKYKNSNMQDEDDTSEQCVQTFIYKEQVNDIEDFLIFLVLDSNNMPSGIYMKTYNPLEKVPEGIINLFLLKNLLVSETIQWNNLIMDNKTRISQTENENAEKDKNKNIEKPQSFLRKYWYAIAILFISLSISKSFTENLQQTMNEYNAEQRN